MRRLALALAATALAVAGGTARADTFAVRGPVALPSAELPNASGSLVLPKPLSTPPAVPPRRTYLQLQTLWERAGAAYGIPWTVLAAINKVESNFGRNMGPSSAGAIGWMQFLPSTWLRWGLDASGDGVADPWNPEDAVHAAARYLAAAGGQSDLPRAVFAYNHAQWYVDEILQLAEVLGRGGGVEGPLTLDRLQVGVDEALAEVARANRALGVLRRRDRALALRQGRLLAQAERAPLFSARLDARKRAVLLGARRDELAAEIARLEADAGRARQEVEEARARSQAAAFAPAAGALLATPTAGGGYVFPVGGGPTVVSVPRDHHDYPAADIAAPTGSPVYALGAAIVESAFHAPEGNCGIGVTLRTEDDLVWTYCHLSYLDPAVEAGSFLPAGAPVGLVGSTGHSTGPHLHLQLQPATAYPQELPWFQALAGSAFSWRGESAPAPVAPRPAHPVFAVVPGPDQGGDDVISFTR
jgi:murein DD-endopeptidase MepM/ murein hydrolase activator NlpD